jgi:hypothetical protein
LLRFLKKIDIIDIDIKEFDIMKKLLFITMLLLTFSLSACKSETRQLDRQWEKHEKKIASFDKVEIKTTVTYVIGDTETDLESFLYTDNELGKTCLAADENDPRGFEDYTVECAAIYGTFNGKSAGFVPYLTEDQYPVHPIHESAIFDDDIMTYFTDEDILEETDSLIRYRTVVDYDELDNRLLQKVITTGLEPQYFEIPIFFNVTYDKNLDMYTSFVIDNTEMMSHLYQINFGYDIFMESYTITVEYLEYTESLNFFYPSSDYVYDVDVNYFDDGDFYGYREFSVGDVIEGELDYDDDQDIVVITAPMSGIYNLTYENSDYQESMLFALYSESFELIYEGVVEEEGHEMKDLYMNAGRYYIVLFTHNNANGYKLLFDKVQ